jgi:hypothetical protein
VALALRDAVVFAEQGRFTRAVFEVDRSELVRIWNLGPSDQSVISPILDDTHELRFSVF